MKTKKPKDRQRSAVYAWERLYRQHAVPLGSLDGCNDLVRRIWQAEARRYGVQKELPPDVLRPHRGQRRGLAYCHLHQIRLPVWARADWYTLHELAHILNHPLEWHGARFVGILIGLLSRHAGFDRDELVASALEYGIHVDQRCIGATPTLAAPSLPEQLLALSPISVMDAACELDTPYKAVFCGYMTLKRQGRASMRRGKVVPRATTPSQGAQA